MGSNQRDEPHLGVLFSTCVLDPGRREAAHLRVSRAWSAYGALSSREEGITYNNEPSVCLSRGSLETQSRPPRPWRCLRQSFPCLPAHLPFNSLCLSSVPHLGARGQVKLPRKGFTHDAELGLSPSSPRLSGPPSLPDGDRTWGPSLSGGCLPGAFLSGMPGSYSTSQSLALTP